MLNSRRALSLVWLSLLIIAGCDLLKPRTTPTTHKPAPLPTPTETTTTTSSLRRNVVDYGEKFVGTQYRYAGTDPKTGFDCSGFTSFVLKQYNVKVSPASSKQATEGRPVALDRVQPGDLIFFGDNPRSIQHVAMLVKRSGSGLVCVHSTTSRGVIVENVTQSSYWKPKILFARDVISK